jgi:hypothetical protein
VTPSASLFLLRVQAFADEVAYGTEESGLRYIKILKRRA